MNGRDSHTTALLFSFFNQLKKAGFALGIDEYKLFIKVLRQSPPAGKEQLLRLLSLLWLKNEKDCGDFENIFKIVFAGLDQQLQPPARPEREAQDREDPNRSPESPDTKPPPPKDKGDEPPPAGDPALPDRPPPTGSADEVSSLRIQLEAKKPAPEAQLESEAEKEYPLNRDYLPVTQRQMTSLWRRLRNTRSPARRMEIDVPATVRKVCQTGFFTQPALRPERRHNRLIILTDQEGSMIAFEALARRITDTAVLLSQHRQVRRFYFHDVPGRTVYEDPLFLQAQELYPLLTTANSPADALLIIGDAGAARGHPNTERMVATVDFLTGIRPLVKNLVWLNPMPEHRWRGTPAAVIAKYVPMYSVREESIRKAIEKLLF